MKVSIISDFNALLTIKGQTFVFNEKQERVEIDFEEQTELFCFVYPIKEKLLPYAIRIEKANEKLSCISPYVQIYQIQDKFYELRLQKFKLTSFDFKNIFSKEIKEYWLILLKAHTNIFLVKEKEKINIFEIEKKLKEVAFDVKEKVPYLVANLNKGKYICLFCSDCQKFYAYEAISLLIKEQEIEIIENLFSYAGHGKKTILKLESGKVYIESEELLYLNQKPEKASNLKVVPFAFFESVRLKDYNLAKSYLSENLQSTLSEEILNDYFGEFNKVVPYNYSLEKGYFISLLTNEFCKVFSFNFENGKISDINLIKTYPLKINRV